MKREQQAGRRIGRPGSNEPSKPPPMSTEQLHEAMHLMLLSRAIDERLTKMQRLGRVGVYGPVSGQEAAVVGSAMALDPRRDWIVPASREQPAWLRHGLPLETLFAIYTGKLDHAVIPQGVNLLPRQQSIGAQLPHAAGLAWALKIRRVKAAVAVYLGEGASSEGDFHEAANLAGVMRVPLVFLLINNQYAISTPARKQTAAVSFAARAAGYGFPGAEIDGNDLVAVYGATTQAVGRALRGEGPSLVVLNTYRLGFHNTSDNPAEYREEAEVSDAARQDPVERARRFMTEAGIWSPDQEAAANQEIQRKVEDAQRLASGYPRPRPEAVFDHVYATLPPRLQLQRTEVVDGID